MKELIADPQVRLARRAALEERMRARAALIATLDRVLTILTLGLPTAGTLAALALLLHGHGPGLSGVIILVISYFATMTGIEVGFHRFFTHQSFRAKPAVHIALGILGSMAAQGPVVWWAATHRRHHGSTDRPGDPHSPNVHGAGLRNRMRGLAHAHIGWLLSPEHTKPAGWAQAGGYLYREPATFFLHMTYFYWVGLGLVLPALAGAIATRTWDGALMGFLWGGLVRIFLTHHFFWAVNSISHSFGGRPFDTGPDKSRNNAWLAIPTVGAGWHNNHHAFPSAAIISFEWWQFDPGAIVIRGFEAAGLVSEVKFPTRETREGRRRSLLARHASRSD